MITYRLPFPPSINRIWRALGGRVVLSVLARTWLKAAHNAMPPGRVPAPLQGRLRVDITLCAPRSLRGKAWDIFNREKLLCDFLTKQRVWRDDSQIDKGTIERGAPDPAGAGYVEITIKEL